MSSADSRDDRSDSTEPRRFADDRDARSRPLDSSASSAELDPVERLVGDWYDRQARRLDVGTLQQRIVDQATAAATSRSADRVDATRTDRERRSSGARRARPGRWGILFAVAASLLLVAILWPQVSDRTVSASSIIADATLVHQQPVERRYEVLTGPVGDDDYPTSILQQVEVVTYGDRFRVEVNRRGRSWIWGEGDDGSIWMVLGPRAAVEFAPDEVGPPLKRLAEFQSLALGSLLAELPRGFVLTRTRSDDGSTFIVRAEPRRPRNGPGLREATVEIDAATREVRSMTLVRRIGDRPDLVTRYRLVGTAPTSPEMFLPEGHLEDRHRIIDRNVPIERRREILANRLGPMVDRWTRIP
ncbi:MAG TPA: hypothetical protein DCQ98_03590 [Planctomycetaceae bacterium]|nr:hypothetical protein [Planctomycetaceae bacterium]HRE99296.1 hypothetical protein [Pirellulaceae bacterium]